MSTSTHHLNQHESGTDQQTEKSRDSGYNKEPDPTSEYLKGHSPDRRAVKIRVPEPEITIDITKRWEH